VNLKNNLVIRKTALSMVLLCCFSILWAQDKTMGTTNIKKGVFYFYPRNSKESFYIVRNDSFQKEINFHTRDTSFWQITWQSDSIFRVQYLKGTKKLSDDESLFYHGHTIVIKVRNITSRYYTFSGGLDLVNGIGNTQDTVWTEPREIEIRR
jgi:hypothetical protein